jgi:hypothetical protein
MSALKQFVNAIPDVIASVVLVRLDNRTTINRPSEGVRIDRRVKILNVGDGQVGKSGRVSYQILLRKSEP